MRLRHLLVAILAILAFVGPSRADGDFRIGVAHNITLWQDVNQALVEAGGRRTDELARDLAAIGPGPAPSAPGPAIRRFAAGLGRLGLRVDMPDSPGAEAEPARWLRQGIVAQAALVNWLITEAGPDARVTHLLRFGPAPEGADEALLANLIDQASRRLDRLAEAEAARLAQQEAVQ